MYRLLRKRHCLFVLSCAVFVFLAAKLSSLIIVDSRYEASKTRDFPGFRRILLKSENAALQAERRRYDVNSERHPWMFPRPFSELENNVVPNHVFFVWCHNRTFTFNDYLSVLSAWKLLEPDKLEIHRGTGMYTDKYNQWLLELNETIPALEIVATSRKENICHNPIQYALAVLSDRGGVYINESIVLLRSVHFLRKHDFTIGVNRLGEVSFIVSTIRNNVLKNILIRSNSMKPKAIAAMLKKSVSATHTISCASISKRPRVSMTHSTRDSERTVCADLSHTAALNPSDLQSLQDDDDLRILKDLFFVELEPSKSACETEGNNHGTSAIPFVVHYVWFGSSEVSFTMYLSFLSALHIAKAERVFIHCNLFLSGPYWRTVSTHPKVTVVYREPPLTIYGRRVVYTQHRSDIVRADVLDRFGGIYVDWDVLWLKSPAPLLAAGHEALVNRDHMPRQPFPDSLNLGVFMARGRARFVRLWRAALRNYRSTDFYYNALELPYKVYERHPDTVRIEERLQVMCFWLKCHPIFHPDHKNWQKAQPFNWKTDVFSIHFTHPDPPEFESIVSLVNASAAAAAGNAPNDFVDIGMYILERSGELDV